MTSIGSGPALALLGLRSMLGAVMLAHGANHIFGGGRIKGTAGWFESMGMKPGILHAWAASLTELGSGGLLIAGLATPLACAGVVGVMLVAWIVNHRQNGFFIFNPGEGWEYVMSLTLTATALALLGAGPWSLDSGLGVRFGPWIGLAIALGAGGGGASLLLITHWRPTSTDRETQADRVDSAR